MGIVCAIFAGRLEFAKSAQTCMCEQEQCSLWMLRVLLSPCLSVQLRNVSVFAWAKHHSSHSYTFSSQLALWAELMMVCKSWADIPIVCVEFQAGIWSLQTTSISRGMLSEYQPVLEQNKRTNCMSLQALSRLPPIPDWANGSALP